MSNMSICGCCGRTTDKSFPFCPWCGTSKVLGKDKNTEEILAQNMADKKYTEQFEHMEEIGRQIDELEKELSVLVLSAEMAK
ncbi:MAG: hypothetical protein MJ182_07065 [Treponema sp.]|nr:hypothetical protein [Treponema sp.]